MGRLQTGRLENLIRRWGSIKGPGSILSETLGDVFPILDLENLPAELLLPAGISLIATSGSATGGVAQLGGVQIQVPAAAGMIFTLTKFHVKTALVQAVSCGLRTPNAPAINSRNLDSRQVQNFNGGLRLLGLTNTAGETGNFIVDTQATIDREVTVPRGIAVLTPGGAFQVTASITNTLIRATFFGYLRLAEPSELSF